MMSFNVANEMKEKKKKTNNEENEQKWKEFLLNLVFDRLTDWTSRKQSRNTMQKWNEIIKSHRLYRFWGIPFAGSVAWTL